MKTYFYSARSDRCDGECQYKTCNKRCLEALQSIVSLNELVVLPGGSHLKTPMSMELRSGDLVLLYAGTKGELEELVSIREVFEPFRIILIVGEMGMARYDHFHLLNPRFTATFDENLNELSCVIQRLTSVNC